MAWLDRINAKKDKVPAMFQDKSEDDILKMMADAANDKAKVTELEGKIVAQEQEQDRFKTQFEEVKTRLVAAEANRNTPSPKKEEEHDFIEHPNEAFNERIAPTQNLAVQTAAVTSRMLAQQQLLNADAVSGGQLMDGRLFQAWQSEIDIEAKKYPVVTLLKPEAWIGIFYYLKGIHADELRDPEIRKKKYNFLESATPPGGQPPPPQKKDGVEALTDQEKHVADKMGVSYENYAKRKATMQFANA